MAGRLVQDIRTTFSASGMSDVKAAAGDVAGAIVDANERQERSYVALETALKQQTLAAVKAAREREAAARAVAEGTAADAVEAQAKADKAVAAADVASARVAGIIRDLGKTLDEEQRAMLSRVNTLAVGYMEAGVTRVQAHARAMRQAVAELGSGGARFDPSLFRAGQLQADHGDRRSAAVDSVRASTSQAVTAALHDEAEAARQVTRAIVQADEAARARAQSGLAEARARSQAAQEQAARELKAMQDAQRAAHDRAEDVLAVAVEKAKVDRAEAAEEARQEKARDAARAREVKEEQAAADARAKAVLEVAALKARDARAEEAAAERVARIQRTAAQANERVARAAAAAQARRIAETRKAWGVLAHDVQGAVRGIDRAFEFFHIPGFFGTLRGALRLTRELARAFLFASRVTSRLTRSVVRLGHHLGRGLFRGAVHGAESLVHVVERLVHAVTRLAVKLAEVGKESLTGVLHAMEKAARFASRWAKRAALVGAAHVALNVREGVKDTQSLNADAKELRDKSVAMNLKPDTVQKLEGLAREHDVDPSKLLGTVSHLDEFLSKANADPSSKEAMALQGLNVRTAERDPNTGRMTDRNPVDVMRDVLMRMYDPANMNASTRYLSAGQREGMLRELFGDDAPASREALQALGMQGQGALEGGLDRARATGTYISAADLAAARQYRDAVEGMRDAMKGLAHTVGRVLTPLFTRLANIATVFLTLNRDSIATYITSHVQAALTSIALIGNLIERETNIGQRLWGLFTENNPQMTAVTAILTVYKFYLNHVKDGLIAVGHAAMWAGHAINRAFVVGHAYWVVYYREQFSRLWQSAREIGHEIGQWAHENNLDTFQGWVDVFRTARDMAVEAYTTIRDGAVEAFTVAREYALLFWRAVGEGQDVGKDHVWLQHLAVWRNEVVTYLRQAWADIRLVMKGEDKPDSTGTDPIQTWVGRQAQNIKWLIKVLPPLWSKAKKIIRAGVEQARKLWADFKKIWAGEKATNFQWLNTLVDAFRTVKARIMEAAEVFKMLYSAADKLFGLFGQDVGKWLMVAGLLRVTGVLGLATAGFGLAVSAVRVFGVTLGAIATILTGGGFAGGLRLLMAAMGMTGAGGAAAITAATGAVASGEAAMTAAGGAAVAAAGGMGAAGAGGAALTAGEFAAGGTLATDAGLGLMGGFAAGGLGLAGGVLYGGAMATARALQETKANMEGVRNNAYASDLHDFQVMLNLRDRVDAITFRGDNDRAGRLNDFKLNAQRIMTPVERAAISRLKIDLSVNGKEVASRLHDLDQDGILRAVADYHALVATPSSTVP